MLTINKWQAACVLGVAFIAGTWLYSEPATPKRDRPVLKALVSLAKWALMIAPFVLGEDEEEPVYSRTVLEHGQLDHARSL